MRRKPLREKPPSLALSFVDTISGGFGAAFFLFLIFASLPVDEDTARAGGGSRFIEVWLKWPDGPSIAEIYLRYNGREWVRFTSGRIQEDQNTGRMTIDGPLKFWRQAFSSGYSRFGEVYMTSPDPMDASKEKRGVRLRLADHCPGTLEVSAGVYGRRTASDWLDTAARSEVAATMKVIVSSGAGSRMVYVAEDVVIGSAANIEPMPLELWPVTGGSQSETEPTLKIMLDEAAVEFDWCRNKT